MPEGLTSIEDLKVVITAETERLTAGLDNARSIISSFSQVTNFRLPDVSSG